jgi:hypothetical protein
MSSSFGHTKNEWGLKKKKNTVKVYDISEDN